MIRMVHLIVTIASLAVVLSYPIYSSDDVNTWSWPANQENVLGDYPNNYERLMGLLLRNNAVLYEKRHSPPALSVINPLEVLRQHMYLENMKYQIIKQKDVMAKNNALLDFLGKRSKMNIVENDSSQTASTSFQE